MVKKFGVVIAALAVLMPVGVFALETRSGDDVRVASDEVIGDDLYISGGIVAIDGVVDGDVIVAGGQVRITGEVQRDLIVAGGEVTIDDGVVLDDLIAAGGRVRVDGSIGDNFTVMAGELEVSEDTTVGGDAQIAGGRLVLRGDFAKEVRFAGGDVVFEGRVGEDASGYVENLFVREGAELNGNLEYEGPNVATIDEGATVVGEESFTESVSEEYAPTAGMIAWSVVTTVIVFAILGFLLRWSVPRGTYEVVGEMMARPLPSAGRGIVFLVLVPVVAVVLFATIVGIPLALVSGVAYMIVMWVGNVMFGLLLAGMALRQKFALDEKKLTADRLQVVLSPTLIALGAVIMAGIRGLTHVPGIGWLFGLVGFVGMLVAIGAIWRVKVATWKRLREKGEL